MDVCQSALAAQASATNKRGRLKGSYNNPYECENKTTIIYVKVKTFLCENDNKKRSNTRPSCSKH